MPVIPSFHGFAATPDYAGAYLGGAKLSADASSDAAQIQVAREKIASEAAIAANRISLGRAQIAADSAQNAMELEAKKQFYSQQAMKQSQEAEIEKAYRDTQFGFKERELKNEEAMTVMRLKEAAQGFDASQNFNRIYQQRLAVGDSEDVAQRTAARSAGPEMAGFAQGISGKATAAPAMDPATKSSVKLLEQEIGEQRRELNKTDDAEERISIQRKINKLTGSLQSLFSSMSPPSAAVAAPVQQQWQVNPASLPYGAPKDASGFIGSPGGSNQFQGPAPAVQLQSPAQSAAPSIPDNFIAYLKAHPNTAASFDKKFGAGAAKAILGTESSSTSDF